MSDPRLLRKRSDTPTPTVVGRSGALPPDVLRDASLRLGKAALVYSFTFTLAWIGGSIATEGLAGAFAHWTDEYVLQSLVSVVSIGMGIAVYILTRRAKIEPERLLDLGLGFEVVGALGISVATVWGLFPEWNDTIRSTFMSPGSYIGVPWECVWIVVFPLLAPSTFGKTTLASLAAASTAPAVLVVSIATGATSRDLPLGTFMGFYVFTTYLCAVIAIGISRVIHRYGTRLQKAREVGSYQLRERLGRGGMGDVWLAEHRMLARPAAIKLIRPEALGADDATRDSVLRRFEREAQATASLRSTHTIELYDFGVTEVGAFYYVMELLEGLNLNELIERFGPVPAGRAAFILRQVCQSLGEAHDGGMTHRDVKPANIYLCRLGPEHDFVKVLDFGLVKTSADVGGDMTELTAQGTTAGTPAYMAPEMAAGAETIDGRADLYALGCVGYWLLTGQRVFDAPNPMAMILEHVRTDAVPPSQRTELEIPAELEATILACLEKDPADRPQTAHDMSARLSETDGWDESRAAAWWGIHMPESGS